MRKKNQSGNAFFYILIAIVLIGLLTAALRSDKGGTNENIDKEAASLQANRIMQYAAEVERGVRFLLDNGASEADLRFAFPGANASYGVITDTPSNQVFSMQGAKVPYRQPPANSTTAAANYEYTAGIAIYGMGSNKADLVLTLSSVALPVCTAINQRLGITTMPQASNCPVTAGFSGTYEASPVTLTYAVTPTSPVLQTCLYCSNLSAYVYAYTLLAR